MNGGRLPFRYVGAHRRCRLSDDLKLKQEEQRQRDAIDRLAQDTEDPIGNHGSDPPVVVYDACVLYPFHLRNLLIELAVHDVVAARWTDAIHDEWVCNLVATRGIPCGDDRRLVDAARANLRRSEPAFEDYIAALENQGLTTFRENTK
jgi:hypothetical protein